MDSHGDESMSRNTHLPGNVHVNPRFAVRPHINKNFQSNFTAAPHINPHFEHTYLMQRSLIDSLNNAAYSSQIGNDPDGIHYNNQNEYSIASLNPQPKIHINPNVLQISNMIHPAVTAVEHVQKSTYVFHSKNKIIRNNPPNMQTKVERSQVAVRPLPVVPKKPSYSLVRKTNAPPPPVADMPKLSYTKTRHKEDDYNSQYKSQIQKYPLHNRVWKRRSIGEAGTNRSRLFNTSKRYSRLSLNSSSNSQVNKIVSSGRQLANHKVKSVFIRGEKYTVNNNALKRVLQADQKSGASKIKDVKMIRVSGVTYVRKSNNVFAVDNRQKMSMKKLKKMNVPCPVYRRYGKCRKNDLEKCPFVHDRKHVSVCFKFLKGTCEIDGCDLSHQATLEKMPACRFFLEGCCVRESCPYLHVNVNDGAKVCPQFIQGYCPNGDQCDSKHINVCPEFYKSGKCAKSKCPYPHRSFEERQPLTLSAYGCKSKSVPKIVDHLRDMKPIEVNENSKQQCSRYFQESSGKSIFSNPDESIQNLEKDSHASEDTENKECVHFLKRPKLGKLPSFIALE